MHCASWTCIAILGLQKAVQCTECRARGGFDPVVLISKFKPHVVPAHWRASNCSGDGTTARLFASKYGPLIKQIKVRTHRHGACFSSHVMCTLGKESGQDSQEGSNSGAVPGRVAGLPLCRWHPGWVSRKRYPDITCHPAQVYWHVIRRGKAYNQGNLPRSYINRQDTLYSPARLLGSMQKTSWRQSSYDVPGLSPSHGICCMRRYMALLFARSL